eukprot:4160433-Amphidinium_carterae.1
MEFAPPLALLSTATFAPTCFFLCVWGSCVWPPRSPSLQYVSTSWDRGATWWSTRQHRGERLDPHSCIG